MLFIFDWDGTLSDSTEKIITCMKRAAVKLHLPMLADTEIREIIGLGLPEAIAQIYPSASPRDRAALGVEYGRQFTMADQQPSAFYPQVLETLGALRSSGHQLSVATGKSRRGLDRVLRTLQLSDFFDATRCADETVSKPDPKMLHELLRYFRCDASEAVMVGDTEYDMAMACAADMPRVAVSYGAHHIGRLRRYNPLLCVDEMPQILTLIE